MYWNAYWANYVSTHIAAIFLDFALLKLELVSILLYCLPMDHLASFFFLFSPSFSFHGLIPGTIWQ